MVCAVGAVLLAACGNGSGGSAAPGGEASDERPCSEVLESLDEPSRVRAETFGGGPEGREAMATIVRTVQQRPDCFSDEEVEFATELAETLPSEAQLEAIEAAEAGCDELGGEFSTSSAGYVAYDIPEEALTNYAGPQLDGVAERSFEGDGRIEFEFHDESGDYQGWVMVEQAEVAGSFGGPSPVEPTPANSDNDHGRPSAHSAMATVRARLATSLDSPRSCLCREPP